MSSAGRQYDIVLYGATGYTGKLTAAHMAAHLPTDTKWAISGRSESKLETVAATCRTLNPDRIQPAIETCSLDDAELGDLARKTKILITTVGPYSMYGEYAFKACAENGTHYIDCTGETPWVHKMIQKYEKTATSTGAIMIPQNGIESAPPDLIIWSLVSLIRNKLSAPTGSVILSQHDLVASMSGGTGFTALTFMDHHTLREIALASAPFALSPLPGPKSHSSRSLLTRLLGIRSHPVLGLLTTAIQASADTPIVQRTWGLLGGPKLYGPNFYYEQYMRTSTYARGIALHFIINIGVVLLALPPVRWLLKKLIYAPGDGPTEEDSKNHRAEYRAVAIADVPTRGPKPRAYCRAYYEGGMYHLTGLFLTQAAITLLKDDVVAKKFGGGILTPATLGQPYIDRVNEAGFRFELRMLEEQEFS